MDRAIGRFHVPAASMVVSSFVAVVVSLGLIDRALLPLWRALTGGRRAPTPLQRIGVGHAARDDPAWVSPLPAAWLVLPFALSGAGEAFHFPAQVTLYYQEFPPSLKNTASGMVAMIVALGFYLSTALVDAVRRATAWLPDNMNASRLENLYWLLAVLVAINFGYYLACAKLYKYQNFGK
ncbi:hypothetical protein OsJ_18114 [Oryza sativa Japonica Group]|uniref:Uncharacterized protein n=1 Tax=Oryza sativa subsp. japonica TaxID=39947 RepID=B9FNY4_ORYSJ|nr:hypothetical protein OsJ_18114 [Oryza sativa Japonica Group]